MNPTEQSENASGTSKFRLLSDSAIVIAGLTGFGYALAYTYENAFCQYFNIPNYVIDPTPTIILQAILAIFLTSIPFIQLASFMGKILGKFPKSLRSHMTVCLISTFMAVGYFGISWTALALSIFMIFMMMGQYILIFTVKGTFSERIEKIDQREQSWHDRDNSLIQKIYIKLGRVPVLLLLYGYLLNVAAASIGAWNARQQIEFYVLSASPDTAIVRKYGDLMLGVKFSESSKNLTGEVAVIKIDGGVNSLVVKKRKIGPLIGSSREIINL